MFSAPNENSEIVSLEKNGNAKALLFLAHWCGYCQKEVPVVQEYVDLIGVPDGIDLIAIATSIDRARDNYPTPYIYDEIVKAALLNCLTALSCSRMQPFYYTS